MSASVGQAVFLAAAGAVGGAVGAAGAITSLISYPALLAIGMPALPANVTHSVAVVASGVGSALGSRRELSANVSRLARWSVIMCIGAAIGAAVLLLTPAGLFTWVVPFLIAGAAILMLVQPRIAAWRLARDTDWHGAVFPCGLFAVAVYDGYFGAASGIMTLALLLVTVESRLLRANVLKNALLAIADVVVGIGFVAFAPVRWSAAVPLAVGFLVGGAIGPQVAQRVPAGALRAVIAAAGFGLAAWLFVDAVRG